MNYKSISIHLLRRTAALAFLMVAFTQSSWAAYYYNKYARIEVVPSDAAKVYVTTQPNTTHSEYMKSETGSLIYFNYRVSAANDKLYATEDTPPADGFRFAKCKIVNKAQNEDGSDNAPTDQEKKDASAIDLTAGMSNYTIEVSTETKEDGHAAVLYGIYFGQKYDGTDNPTNYNKWHEKPDAYLYLYCGQVITDKYNLPARDESYEYVCYDRTFYKGWNSVCLPFGIKTDDFKAKLGDGCKLATFKDYNAAGNTLQFETVDEVAAGVPCLIWSDNEGAAVSLSINPTERDYVTSPVNGEYMKGTFINNSYYGKKILRLADENSFAWTSDDPMVISYRAWIEIPEGSAKALTIDIDGETTAISAVEAADTMPAKVYTASGVQTKSTVKGLNIVKASDGRVKKVMVK